MKTGEVLFEKAYMSPRPPPKISSRHDWTKELGSEVARQPRGEVSQQTKFFQPTQPIPKPICDRSLQPDNKHEVFVDKGETSWSREIKEKSSPWSREIKETSSHEELCRSGQPDKHEIALRAAPEVHREITTLNTDNELTRERIEEDMEFKIPGLPNSTVKQLQSASVRELIQKNREPPEPTCSSTRLYNRVNHLIPSVKNQNK